METLSNLINPDYTIKKYPDNCWICKEPFDYDQHSWLPFFTLIIRCRHKRVCRDCFNVFDLMKYWRG